MRTKPANLWYCGGCHWTGSNPSISDASEVRQVGGELVVDRLHILICPVCFASGLARCASAAA